MATYNIDNITLPSGDVCNLREPYNMVINGGPEFATLWGGSPGYPTGVGGLGWSLTNTGTSGAAYPLDTTYSDTTSYLKKNDIQLKFRTSDDTKFVQLQHIICNTAWVGAVDLTPLKDNDTITISFDYKSDSQLFLKIRFDIKETSDSAPVEIADHSSDDRKTLSAQADWVRVSYTYTVPSGVTALVQKIPNLYQSYFVLQIYPTLAESYAHFRNFSICKGSNISYIPNDGSGCFISVRSNYYTSTTSAFSRFNAGNVSGYTGDYYFPTTSIKATNGAWSQGVTSSDDVYKFVYMSDQSLTDNKNYAERFCLPATTGEDASYNIITTKNISDIPDASATQAGKVNTDTTTAQLFRGIKTFDSDTITIANGSSRDTHNYAQIQFNDKTFSSDPDTGNGTRAGYIAVGRPALGSSSGNVMRFMIRSPLSDGTGYTSYYDSFTLPAPSAGNTDYGWYSILTTKNTKTYTASLTTAGWSSNTQTVTVTGMTADAIIMVSAAPASEATYRHSGVYCSAQAANSLTFTCASTPTAAITVNILTIG